MAAPQDREEASASPSRQLPPDAQLHRSAQDRVGGLVGGRYRLERLLGLGSMAAVYSAVHSRNESRVAIKVLHRELAGDDELCSRFLREGYLSNRVSHPAVVRVIDDDITVDGTLFLVMDLVQGETLERRVNRCGGKLGVAEVVPILAELLDVLAAAHDRGIVHRDIKPENLAITASGQVKLLDFGVARDEDPSSTRTIMGTVIGTPGFMSPEQALGRTSEIDALSDLWSVGAMAFALLSGRLVHAGESARETLARAALMRAPPLARVAPEVPRAVAEVIDRALAFDRASRWPNARAMRDALQRAAGERASVPPPSSLVPFELPPVRTSWMSRPAVVSPSVVTDAEERRWRRDLRRSRSGPFSFAALALGIAVLAANATRGGLPHLWGSIAAHGLVSAAVPALPAEPSVLPAPAPLEIQSRAGAVGVAPSTGPLAAARESRSAATGSIAARRVDGPTRRALPPLPPPPLARDAGAADLSALSAAVDPRSAPRGDSERTGEDDGLDEADENDPTPGARAGQALVASGAAAGDASAIEERSGLAVRDGGASPRSRDDAPSFAAASTR